METYVTLGTGLSGENADVARKKAFEQTGCKEIGAYMLMGRYDFLIVFEAPDAESAAMGIYAARKAVGMDTVHTETMRAFPESEVIRFIEKTQNRTNV